MTAPRAVYGIGDSLMLNENAPGTLLFHLRPMLGDGAYVKAQGIGGDTATVMRWRLERDVIDQDPRPDACVVLAGVNDLQNNAPAAAIIANLEAMYRMLLDAHIHPIALTIYPFGDHDSWSVDREAARQEVREWMRNQLPVSLPEVEVVDVEDVIGDLRDEGRPRLRAEYVADGIHTNPAGAAAVACAVFERSRWLRGSQG